MARSLVALFQINSEYNRHSGSVRVGLDSGFAKCHVK